MLLDWAGALAPSVSPAEPESSFLSLARHVLPQVTSNRSLDGVLDVLNSKHLTDAGPLQLIDYEGGDADEELLPPGGNPAAAAGVPGAAGKRPVARTRALALSPTGRRRKRR